RAFSKKASATLVGQRHAPEVTAEDVRDAIVLRKPLVHERVVGGQQIDDVSVLADDAPKEQLGLASERLAKVVVEVGEKIRVGNDPAQVPQLQPLAGEVGHERIRSWIRQHPSDLLVENLRLAEAAAVRHRQQLVVRDAAPQKERKARGEIVRFDAV